MILSGYDIGTLKKRLNTLICVVHAYLHVIVIIHLSLAIKTYNYSVYKMIISRIILCCSHKYRLLVQIVDYRMTPSVVILFCASHK